MLAGRVFLIFCLFLVATAGHAQSRGPLQISKSVCSFYGEQSPGQPAYNKDESCTIPDMALLDKNFRQGNFVGSGGGAKTPTTSVDIPPGLEVKVDGGYYWSVSNPRLSGDTFSVHLYCGPGAPGQPGCNVKVEVIAHYQVVPTDKESPVTQAGGNGTGQNTPVSSTDQETEQPTLLGMPVDKALAFGFGVTFVVILLLIAIFDRNPTPLAIFIYRVVLALAAAGIGAVLPGLIEVNINPIVRAGGAIALFVLVYMVRPAELIANPRPPEKPNTTGPVPPKALES